MAKKQLTPEQYKEKNEKKALKSQSFFNTFISALAVLLAVVITFSVVSTAYTYAGSVKKNVAASNPSVQQAPSGDVNVPSEPSAPSDDDSVLSPDTENENPITDNEAPNNEGDNTQADKPADKEQSGGFASTAEMVTYFNECANKVKGDAVKVVKNYEKRGVGELKVPDILQSMAEGLLKSSMKDDTDPIVYDTKEEIKENFLVPNQSYVSRLKASDVAQANCKDNGKEYVIYFKLKDEKDPRAGSGVASVCDVIEAYEVAEKAPSIVTEFSTYYYNCEVTATIDKATGRLTHIIYSTPLTLNVAVDFLGTHTASVGFTFVKDYTITY